MRAKPIFIILAAFVLLTACYAYATPIFESPDEVTHVGFMDYVASTGQIPVQVVGVRTRWEQEGSQPPLYYLITGWLTRWTDRSDYDAVSRLNPHAIIGDPSSDGNKNMVLHDTPYPLHLSGTTLAVLVARTFSILCGAVTVFAVYQCGRALAPDKPAVALLAAGLTAFNPQFLFISASVNNDNLVTALNSLAIWLLLVLLRTGFSTRRSIALALLIALASLTKLSGLVLIPVVALAGLWKVYRTRDWRGLITLGGLMAICWSVVAGWWYVRNLMLYGDLTGMQRMLDIFGRRPAPPLGELVLGEADGLRMSFWGLFGWFNVLTFQPFYWAMDILTALGLVGLAVSAWKMRREQLIKASFLALIIVIGLGSLITWTSQTAATQGRLLFPFIAAIMCLLALGLARLRLPALAVVPLGVFALAVPFVTIMPAYAPPPLLTELPPQASPVYAQWKDMALVGYEMQPRRFAPGDAVPITLYWKPVQVSDADYSLFIRLLDPDGNIIARLPSYPGYGRLRTSTWQAGYIYPDHYVIHIPRDVTGQFALRAYVGWWEFPAGTPLDPVDDRGQSIAQVMFSAGGLVSAGGSTPLEAVHPEEQVDFGGVISLVGYTLDGSDLTLHWQATASIDDDYTVFVQVLKDGVIVMQGDAPPLLPTRFWRPGEYYQTHHHLVGGNRVPQGEFSLYVGWYSSVRPLRLAVDAPDNAYALTTIRIGT